MRILVLNADYLRFQAWLYRREPGLENAPYAAQMAARNASLFGLANFYSKNFTAMGHAAAEIHVNNPWLQTAWAREHGMPSEPPEATASAERRPLPGWLERAVTPFKPILRPLARKVGLSPKLDQQAENILLAQIEQFKPDLVLNQDLFHIDTKLMRRIKEIGNPIAIGQVGIEPSRGEDWSAYDLMISQLPTTVNFFRALGVRAEVNHLAFEPAILDVLPEKPAADIDVSFVGSVSVDHLQRIALLEAVAERYDLKLWGNRPQALPASSPLHRCFQGEVWGTDMYQVLRRSRITLNSHIDLAGREAGNMRLFEATGVGAFLLTDFKDNLHTLFAPDREVAVWRSINDCLSAIDHHLADDKGRAEIAHAGQAKTMAQHTYRHRASEILSFVDGIGARR
ncbi:Spore maturation protein CgeB [Bradyrhizobium lablabi]|uniref:Spore maturation protein CgeB n=1 Tax=Bradyrhizobium lablabi TaxID=722472 RepID=A0A1M7B6N7_9BRAD|nr:glycosyltransferase [Bradyrhizobium lablabi]SHL50613.1 Spore maturation protein CgeB [Bradyrhizobium lablabi]